MKRAEMSDEEFVRAHWEPYKWHAIDSGPLDGAMFKIYDDGHIASGGLPDVAEFTRERLEEIRQVRQDIAWCAAFGPEFTREELDRLADDCDPEDGGPSYFCVHHLPEAVRDWCARNRILARLESALAELTRGMKGDA